MPDGRTTVLIAEDDPDAARLLADQLRAVPGVECIGMAGDGCAALAMLDRLRPDVLLLNLGLPKISGIGVLQELQTRSPELRPRVIILSHLINDPIKSKVAALGAEFYFTKPVRIQELAQVLWHPGPPTAEELLERMLGEVEGSSSFFWAASALRALAGDPKLKLAQAYVPAMINDKVTYATVEKGLRDLIKRAEQRGSITYRTHFTSRPCVGTFLRRLAREIQH